MWTAEFWRAAAERAIRAAAACLVSLLTVASFDPTDAMGWRASLIAAGMAALVSLLMSVAAGTVGDPTDPSFISRKDNSNGNQG